jgi:RNA polymerase sigma factor (sigma-70 family)
VSDDGDLLSAWRAGDRAAGAELFSRHFAAVYGFFRNKLEDAAEDMTQQTFLRCVESRDVFRGDEASFRTYMFQIARNLLYEQIRRRSVRNQDPDFEIDSLADLVASPSANLGARQEHRVLLEAMRRLPLSLQVALELYYVQRLRGEDIAVVLAIPVGTVRSRIRRALERLREVVAELSATPQTWRTTLTDLQRWAAGVRDAAARSPTAARPDAD